MKPGYLPLLIHISRFIPIFYKPVAVKIKPMLASEKPFHPLPITAFTQVRYDCTHYCETLEVYVLEIDKSTVPEGFIVEGIEDRSDKR